MGKIISKKSLSYKVAQYTEKTKITLPIKFMKVLISF